MIRIAVVDDNRDYTEIEDLTSSYVRKDGVVTRYYSATDYICNLNCTFFDILFLDYNLEGATTGYDIVKIIDELERRPLIIMVTSYTDPTVMRKAVQSNIFDYLVKDMVGKCLLPCLDTAIKVLYGQDRLKVKTGTCFHLIEYINLYSVLSLGDDLVFKLRNSQLKARARLKEYKPPLLEHGFIEAKSNYLINKQHIDEFDRKHVVMINGEVIKLSRSGYRKIKNSMGIGDELNG